MDPYSDAYTQPSQPAEPVKEKVLSPRRSRSRSRTRSPSFRHSPPRHKRSGQIAPNPSKVLGVFGLSIRSTERDLDDEFTRYGSVEKVTIVYDQRSGRSRGFGFISMSTVEEATRCIEKLNGIELNGRRIRVDYSVTDRPHAPTPGEYMGHRRSGRDSYRGSNGGRERDRDRDDYHRDRDRERYRDRSPRRYDRDRRDRDSGRDWRDRRSPRGHSPDRRRRRSYSRSPARGSPGRSRERDRDHD